jgi:hypothetical protein
MAAVAALGGLEFALFVVCLIVGGVYLHRHRAAGLHSRAGVPRTEKAGAGFAPAPGVMYPQPMPVYGMPPQHTGSFPPQGHQMMAPPPMMYPQHTGSTQPVSMYGAPAGYMQPGNTMSMYGGQMPPPQHTGTPVQHAAPYQAPQHTGNGGEIVQPTPTYPPQAPSPLQSQHTGPPPPQQQQQQPPVQSPPAGGYSYGPGTNTAPYQPPGQ